MHLGQMPVFLPICRNRSFLFLRNRPNHLSRHPHNKAPRWDNGIFRHQGPRCHQRAGPNHRTVQNRGVHADQTIIPHGTPMHHGTVANGHIPSNHHIQPRAGVQHGVVLHVAARTNGDAPGIGPQHRAVPDAALLGQGHIPRQRGVVRHKRRRTHLRRTAIYFINRHNSPS